MRVEGFIFMKRKFYYEVNIIVAVIYFVFLIHMFQSIQFPAALNLLNGKLLILLAVLCAGMVHLLKGLRLYFILMEKCISPKRFLKIYTKTTLVTLVLPWKTGEFFRIYCLGDEMKDYRSSFLSVLADRYFDSIPLLIVIVLYGIISLDRPLIFTWVLLFFIIFTTLLYIIFPSLYQYFNRFIIMKTKSKSGIIILDFLEKIRQWYSYAEQLVKGRSTLLLLLSFGAWITEYIALSILSVFFNFRFELVHFVHYLNHVFSGSSGELEIFYAVLLVFVVSITYVAVSIKSVKRKRNHEKNFTCL